MATSSSSLTGSLLESETLELMEGVENTDRIVATVSAFLNSGGGVLILGATEDGICGVGNALDLQPKLEKLLLSKITPTSIWSVDTVSVGDKALVTINVPEGGEKPYVCAEGVFVRRGAASVRAQASDLIQLVSRRVEANERWERALAIGAELEDLNLDLVSSVAKLGAKSGRWQGASDEPEHFLHSLGLAAEGRITNAAVVLFGRNPARFLPQMRTRLIVSPDGKTGGHYFSDQVFEGPLIEVARELPMALERFTEHSQVSFPSAGSWQRVERPPIPAQALREGIMNALVHRDFSLTGGVLIEITSRGVEITNPGGLPDKVKVADLKRSHLSLPRNPDIAHVCFLARLIEKVGRGTQLIYESCMNSGLPAPVWHVSGFQTALVFPNAGSEANYTASQTGESSMERASLNARQRRILDEVRKLGAISYRQAIEISGTDVTERTVRNDLDALVAAGLLIRLGSRRSYSYAAANPEGSQL